MTATPSTATPAIGRRPTRTARAWAASGTWSRPAAARPRRPSRGSRATTGGICFASDPVNLDALGSTLVGLRAQLRGVAEPVAFTPDAGTLKRVGIHYDVGGFEVRVASVEDLIAMKTAAGRVKDLGDIEELEAILRLRAEG